MKSYSKEYLYKRVVKAKMFIDDNFAEKLDLSEIANSANFSKYHFLRLFKEIYGVSPQAYLTFVRIEKSKALLAKNVTILEIANSIGFESPTSYSAVFKRLTKMKPSEYRVHVADQRSQIKETPLKFVPGCFAHSRGWLKK
jgi:AraC-like DNA-binding protein